ncbi:MAG: hypothetical protein LBT15_04155 [Synergistaceae bacterium]|jgi:hypothetical protein|nr:hypothetical protein [Synergistaceae bacterium]
MTKARDRQERDLSGFREALLAQHMERTLARKRVVDEEIADIITARRLEVEGVVHRLRRASADELNEGLSANRRYGESRTRFRRAELRDDFIARLEKSVAGRLRELRSAPGYGRILIALAVEAAEVLSPPFVVLVEKGDAVFLTSETGFSDRTGNNPQASEGSTPLAFDFNRDVSEIREDLKDSWGGLVLVGAKGRLVDNTFRTRWKRLYPSFAGKLAERMESALKEEI